MEDIQNRLINVTKLAHQYCVALEDCRSMEKMEFVTLMLELLPRLYLEFSNIIPEHNHIEEEYTEFFGTYLDEDYYDSIRRNIESLLGSSDTFLETFEEDMKYSDTPIASSISECLSDIFQPLYNFTSVVKDTEGDSLVPAYLECRENFIAYWSQTLCNVLRALNHLKYS